MSLHSSLKSANTMKRHRSVLSRLERVQLLKERGLLNVEESSLSGLPKVKHLKIRVRKEKAAAPAAGTSEAAAPSTAGAPASSAVPSGGKSAQKTPVGSPKPEAGGAAKKKD